MFSSRCALSTFASTALLALAPRPVFADQGQVMATTDLREKPEATAPVIGQLASGTAVEIGIRQGAFYQVKTATAAGFVRMLSVRMVAAVRAAEPPPSAAVVLSQAARSSTTVATGIRGLSRTDLERAEENPAAVAQLEQYRVSVEEARQFGTATATATASPASGR